MGAFSSVVRVKQLRKMRPFSDKKKTAIRSCKQVDIVTISTLNCVVIEKMHAQIDRRTTRIEETQNVLKYKTPHFRAKAEISFPPLAEDECWDIGWIQACTHMKFINTYGNVGYTSWEFREVETGQCVMISDSDGKLYPWYGSSKEQLVHLKGPSVEQKVTVAMHDNFCPQVTWVVPSKKLESKPALSHIKRDQNFYTWLVARNARNNEYHILKTIKWRAKLEIQVNPDNELGKRASLETEDMTRENLVIKECIPIPKNVLYPETHANAAQVLVWRPFLGEPKIVIFPEIKSRLDDDNLVVNHLQEEIYPMRPDEQDLAQIVEIRFNSTKSEKRSI